MRNGKRREQPPPTDTSAHQEEPRMTNTSPEPQGQKSARHASPNQATHTDENIFPNSPPKASASNKTPPASPKPQGTPPHRHGSPSGPGLFSPTRRSSTELQAPQAPQAPTRKKARARNNQVHTDKHPPFQINTSCDLGNAIDLDVTTNIMEELRIRGGVIHLAEQVQIHISPHLEGFDYIFPVTKLTVQQQTWTLKTNTFYLSHYLSTKENGKPLTIRLFMLTPPPPTDDLRTAPPNSTPLPFNMLIESTRVQRGITDRTAFDEQLKQINCIKTSFDHPIMAYERKERVFYIDNQGKAQVITREEAETLEQMKSRAMEQQPIAPDSQQQEEKPKEEKPSTLCP